MIEPTPSTATMQKALRLLKTGGVREDTEHPGSVFWVRGSRTYRVQVVNNGEHYTCTCPNGKVLGGDPTCYHTLAVAFYLEG